MMARRPWRRPIYDPHFYHYLNVIDAAEQFGSHRNFSVKSSMPNGEPDTVFLHEAPRPALYYIRRQLEERYGPLLAPCRTVR